MENLKPYIKETIEDLFQKSFPFLLERSLDSAVSKESIRNFWQNASEEQKKQLNAKLLLELGILTSEEAEDFIEAEFIEKRMLWDKLDDNMKKEQNVAFLFYYDVISENEYLKYKR